MSPAPDRSSGQQRRPDQHRVVRDSLLAGSVAGIASTLACHPFDVIRTKMQTAGMTAGAGSSGAAGSSSAATVAARGPLVLVSHTLAHGGVRALYTGLALPLAAQAVYKGTIFTVNGVARSALTERRARTQEGRRGTDAGAAASGPRELTLGDSFLCGFAGGAVNAALFVTPVEYVRNQLIAQHTRLAAAGGGVGQGPASRARWEGPVDVVRHVVSRRGVLGLWRGMAITVARDSVGCGCFFLAVEWTNRRLRPSPSSGEGQEGGPSSPALATSIASGALAGLAYWAAALPLDALKTWVQTDAVPSAAAGLRDSLREHGAAGTAGRLLRGWPAAYARGVPSAAITVTTYSVCHGALAGTGR